GAADPEPAEGADLLANQVGDQQHHHENDDEQLVVAEIPKGFGQENIIRVDSSYGSSSTSHPIRVLRRKAAPGRALAASRTARRTRFCGRSGKAPQGAPPDGQLSPSGTRKGRLCRVRRTEEKRQFRGAAGATARPN